MGGMIQITMNPRKNYGGEESAQLESKVNRPSTPKNPSKHHLFNKYSGLLDTTEGAGGVYTCYVSPILGLESRPVTRTNPQLFALHHLNIPPKVPTKSFST